MPLLASLKRIFSLLKKTQPLQDQFDVVWQGPFFIPRSGQWYSSHFTLYRGTLHVQLVIPPGRYALSWLVKSKEVKIEKEMFSGRYYNDESLWETALSQIEHRLRSAVKNTARYNRFVEKNLPLSCRTGKIERAKTWPKNAKKPFSLGQMQALNKALTDAGNYPLLSKMTLSHYLKAVAIAYNAGFKELRSLSALEKYKKKADGRHGGLLNLPQHDADAFEKWFHSKAWQGTHPWEIVFGQPHGIMLSPRYHDKKASWIYCLWVESLGWYVTAAQMAMALAAHKVPYEFYNQKALVEALQGCDEVDVGPDLYAVNFDELRKERPEVIAAIRWEPISKINPITDDQRTRVQQSENKMSKVKP